MAEQLLNHSQVGAAVEQMRGKAVAQAMGTHFDFNARELEMFLDDARNAARGNAPAAMVEKDRRRTAAGDLPLEPHRLGVGCQSLERRRAGQAQDAAGQHLPLEGTVLITVADRDKPAVIEVARRFAELGFRIKATQGTRALLEAHGIPSELILKMREGRPNIADAIMDGEIQLIINTPRGKVGKADDAYIRHTAVKRKVTYITTLAAAVAAAKGIAADRQGHGQVKSLQDYHADIK